MKITNTQPGPRGVNTVNGPVLIDPKQTIEAQVYEREKASLEASGWFTVGGDYTPNPDVQRAPAAPAGQQDTKIADLQKQVDDLNAKLTAKDTEIANLQKGAVTIEAKHRGAGSYSVQFGEFELREKLSKDQAEAFNALDADAKAKWLADNPKPAA